MRTRRGVATAALVAIAALAAFAASCGPDWRPASDLEDLRVLALRAEPADVAPGGATRLSALVVDASAPGRANTVLWLACDPDPASPDQPACSKFSTLEDGSQLGSGQALPPGMRPLSPGPSDTPYLEATYDAPADLFAQLAADDPARRAGKLAYILALAVAAPPPATYPPNPAELAALMAKVQNGEVKSVMALKRLRISEDPSPNQNPTIDGLRVETALWPGLRPLKLRPSETYALTGESTLAETYQQLDADKNLVTKTERLIFSWFSTYGVFKFPRTMAGEAQSFIINSPFDDVPADGLASIYVVLRDGRGGVTWMERAMFVCDPFADAPTLSGVEPASGPPGTEVTLRGERLDQVLDVQIGAEFLAAARYDSTRGGVIGTIPPSTTPGQVTLQARGRSCRPDPQIAFEVTPP